MKKIIVCINLRANPAQPSCAARGGEIIAERLEQKILQAGLKLTVERFPCLGRCALGPNARMAPAGKFLCELDPEHLETAMAEIMAFAGQA